MSNENVHVRAGGVQSRYGQGFVGQVITAGETDTLLNKAPQAKQVTTVSIPASPGNSTEYSVTIDGASASFTTDASATQAELGAGLVAAIEAAAAVYGRMVPSYSGGTLTLTGRAVGVAYTVTASGGSGGGAIGTPSNSTTAADADRVSVGRAMIVTGYSSDTAMNGVKLGHVPTTADFTAQVMTFTVAGAGGDSFTPQVTINGKRYLGDAVAFNTNAATTATDIATEINAIMPTETVLAAATSGGALTLTAEVEGAEFEAVITAAVSGEVVKAYTTGPDIDTSFARKWKQGGVSTYRFDLEHSTIGGDDPSYGPNESVVALRDGDIWVQTAQTIAYGEEVYVSLASATKGRFYNDAGTDRVWVSPNLARWERPSRTGANYATDIAAIRVNLR